MMCRNIRNFVLMAMCAFAYPVQAQDMLCEVLPDCTDLGYELTVTCSEAETLACPYDTRYKKCVNPSCETLGFTKADKTKWCKNIITCSTDASYTLCAEGCGKICPSESSIDPSCQYGRTSVDTDGCGNTCYRCNICPEDEQTGYTTAALSCTSSQYALAKLTSHCGAPDEKYLCADCPTGMKAPYTNSFKCVCDSTQGYTTSCPAHAVCQGTASIFGPCQRVEGCQEGYKLDSEGNCVTDNCPVGSIDRSNIAGQENMYSCQTTGSGLECCTCVAYDDCDSSYNYDYSADLPEHAKCNDCYTSCTKRTVRTDGTCAVSYDYKVVRCETGYTWNGSSCDKDCNDVCGEGAFADYPYTSETEASANGGYNTDNKQKCDNNYCYKRGVCNNETGHFVTEQECEDDMASPYAVCKEINGCWTFDKYECDNAKGYYETMPTGATGRKDGMCYVPASCDTENGYTENTSDSHYLYHNFGSTPYTFNKRTGNNVSPVTCYKTDGCKSRYYSAYVYPKSTWESFYAGCIAEEDRDFDFGGTVCVRASTDTCAEGKVSENECSTANFTSCGSVGDLTCGTCNSGGSNVTCHELDSDYTNILPEDNQFHEKVTNFKGSGLNCYNKEVSYTWQELGIYGNGSQNVAKCDLMGNINEMREKEAFYVGSAMSGNSYSEACTKAALRLAHSKSIIANGFNFDTSDNRYCNTSDKGYEHYEEAYCTYTTNGRTYQAHINASSNDSSLKKIAVILASEDDDIMVFRSQPREVYECCRYNADGDNKSYNMNDIPGCAPDRVYKLIGEELKVLYSGRTFTAYGCGNYNYY